MRAPLPALITAVLALACSRPQPKDTEPTPTAAAPTEQAPTEHGEDAAWLEAAAANGLVGALGDLELDASAEAARVSVGEHALTVDVDIEHAMVHDGQYVLAAAFMLELDGQPVPAFTAGAIGIGRDLDEARETAIAEWFGQYGAPIAFALAQHEFRGQARPPGEGKLAADFYIPLQVDGRPLFASPVGLRGNASDVEALTTDTFMLGLLEAIAPLAGSSAGYHTLTVQVSVEDTKVEDAGCFVDGLESAELFEVLGKRSWPAGAPGYMYKQFFVFY